MTPEERAKSRREAYTKLLEIAAAMAGPQPLRQLHAIDERGKALVGRRELLRAIDDADDRLKRMAYEMRQAADVLMST